MLNKNIKCPKCKTHMYKTDSDTWDDVTTSWYTCKECGVVVIRYKYKDKLIGEEINENSRRQTSY